MNIAEDLVEKLTEKNYTVVTVESCTGGMISSKIIDIAGASSVINEAHVTYSNEAKMKYLGVKAETLERYGAVSKETVEEMLVGGSKLANANMAIAVSGLAGPGGATKEKPVGLVYVGCWLNDKMKVKEYIFDGDRSEIREQTAKKALELAERMLAEEK